ncbi:MAG: type IV secretory system conjugative DNA transfer family protein [Alphaproteobacteria bacterium]|nr:type IV secretory system conjugative DNA transfer family protein [Alphaproteobacteria bacterium]
MNVKSIFLPPQKTWKWLIYLLIIGLLSFFVFSLIFFSAYIFIRYGLSQKTFEYAGLANLNLLNIPAYVMKSYNSWIFAFNEGLRAETFRKLLLIPFLAPVMTFVVLSIFIVRRPTSSLSDKNYFATFEDVKTLDVFGDSYMVLGRLNNHFLKPSKATSSLVWFSAGLGKTVSIAVPTILESAGTNLVAVDCSGTLSKFTSGYRAGISRVYNFNWDKIDHIENGEFYARWNPLSAGNLPRKNKARVAYVKSISQYLIVKDVENYWEKMSSLTLEAIIHFFVSKVEQASANDYFLSRFLENGRLTSDDRDLLKDYYLFMPEELTQEVLKFLDAGHLTIDNYLPIGSWYGIPELWRGKEICFAMIVDTLLYIYCDANLDDNVEMAVWKEMLQEFRQEALLFGYNWQYFGVIDNLIHFTPRQRKVIFGIILDALSSFRKKSVRERTSLSDFNLSSIRGMINEETGERELVSVYSSAGKKSSAFMTELLVDMLLGININLKPSLTETPIMFVLDDFEVLPKFKLLNESMGFAEEKNMSFMLLTRDLETVEQIYDKDTLEDIVLKTEYKLFSSNQNEDLSEKLKVVGSYVAKAVPESNAARVFSKPVLRSELYSNVSKDLLSPKVEPLGKGKYILFSDVSYGRPIKVDSIFFAKNQAMRSLASLPEEIFVSQALLDKRNLQDVEVPNIIEVVRQTGVDITSEKDIQDYVMKQKNIVSENIAKIQQSSALAEQNDDNISFERQQKIKNKNIKNMEKEDNWWLNENSFSAAENGHKNPFGN